MVGDANYNPQDLIAALATPWGTSALAVIRTSGEGSIDRVAELFSRPKALRNAARGSLLHGTLAKPGKQGEVLDEVILAVFRSPKSYTAEDSVEIFCHGSLPGISAILGALREVGFRDAQPGEFTLRAFLGGKIDLTRAEAVREIVESKSLKAHEMALGRLSGSIYRRIDEAKHTLESLMAAIEVLLDYPEDEVPEDTAIDLEVLRHAEKELIELRDSYQTGHLYQKGIRIAIAGGTNAGKSSLFNLFLKEDRSIVSQFHGTTRDFIESWISINGIPVTLIDTAGLRRGVNPVEAEGIKRTEEILDSVELILYMVDATSGLGDADSSFLSSHGIEARCVRVWNKIDLTDNQAPKDFMPVCAISGEGFSRLEREIVDRLAVSNGSGDLDLVAIYSDRQKELLDRALQYLGIVKDSVAGGVPFDAIALDLRLGLDALGEIIGEVTTADILDKIFADFCVGK